MNETQSAGLGVVVIGRNEGERLITCLESVIGGNLPVVYVDSGSADGSAQAARSMGVEVIELTADRPFTAARGRNEGIDRLLEIDSGLEFVQFIDGDCEMLGDWLHVAREFLVSHEDVAAVCGRLRERHPDKSVYNRLCDLEWDGPSGEIDACGGIVMMRIAPFLDVHGFRTDLIAGEEPELCLRLRQRQWKVWRLSADMALHDAEMLHFSQWWTRMVRTGFAFAQSVDLHRDIPERSGRRQMWSALVWGLGLPLLVAGLCLSGNWLPGAIVLLAYPLQIVRLAMRGGLEPRLRWINATFLVLGKFPEVIGTMKYVFSGLFRKPARLIEYK